MQRSRFLVAAACAATTLVVGACADSTDPVAVAPTTAVSDKVDASYDLDLQLTLDTIAVGDTAHVRAIGAKAGSASLTLYAVDSSVLRVSPAGLLTGLKLGRSRLIGVLEVAPWPVVYHDVYVMATSGTRTPFGGITPPPTPLPVPTPTPTPTSGPLALQLTLDTIAVGDTAHVRPIGTLAGSARMTLYAVDSSVLKVDQAGLLTGLKLGRSRLIGVLEVAPWPVVYHDVYVMARSGTRTPFGGTTPPPTPTPVPTPTPTPTGGKWVAGYYVGYQRDLYPETAIDFSTMTHVIVGAIQPTSTGGVTTDFYVGATAGPAMAKTIATRAHAAGRKAILMLGGAGSLAALKSASSSTYRATFVATLVRTMDDLGYDGIDVDWEPLAPGDEAQALALLKALRAARPAMLLTFPVGWVGAGAASEAWFGQLAGVVDQINIMSYEMAGGWSGWTAWHEGALAGEGSSHPTSIASTVQMYLASGVPAAKLGIGLGAYGSCWRGPTAPGQAVGAGVVASDNTMTYAAIMRTYYNAANYHYDATAKEGYLGFAAPTGPQGCTFLSYEDPQAIRDKGAYVTRMGLGGAIVWTLNQGHVASAPAGQQDPLMSAAYGAIVP